MNRVRAFVVGISRYFADDWRLDGASRNAAAVTRWLRDNGVPAERIHLFCDRAALDAETCRWLDGADDGTRIEIGATKQDVLNTFWRQTLPNLAEPDDRLFVFWSGHGMTDASRQRLFFCGDYSTQLVNNVFNASAFAAELCGPAYSKYGARLLFSDVCGNYAKAVTAAAPSSAEDLESVDQLAVFASVDGEFAEVDERAGAFTKALLEALAGFKEEWPAQARFLTRFREVLKTADVHPLMVSWTGRSEQERGWSVGRPPATCARSAYAMLQPHSTEAIQLLHYGNTQTSLCRRGPRGTETLLEMVDALADLLDSGDRGAPYGLVEFLMRLAADPALGADGTRDIEAWIEANGKEHRREAKERLARERLHRRLLIEVGHVAGKLSEVSTHLRFPNNVPDPAIPSETRPVETWDELAGQVRRWIEDPRMEPRSGDLELHFLVDPTQFELPFHRIELSGGRLLGEEYLCVVHSLTRANMADRKVAVDRWQSWARAVSETPAATLPLKPLTVGASAPSEGICYLGFPLAARSMDVAKEEQLRTLLKRGAPLIFWHHEAQAVAADLAAPLRELVDAAGTAAALPRALLDRRFDACPVASQVTLLWDEPRFRPFVMMQGDGA